MIESRLAAYENLEIPVQLKAGQEVRGFIECLCNGRVEDFAGEVVLDFGERVGMRNFSFTADMGGKYSFLLHYPYSGGGSPYTLNYSIFTHYNTGEVMGK